MNLLGYLCLFLCVLTLHCFGLHASLDSALASVSNNKEVGNLILQVDLQVVSELWLSSLFKTEQNRVFEPLVKHLEVFLNLKL